MKVLIPESLWDHVQAAGSLYLPRFVWISSEVYDPSTQVALKPVIASTTGASRYWSEKDYADRYAHKAPDDVLRTLSGGTHTAHGCQPLPAAAVLGDAHISKIIARMAFQPPETPCCEHRWCWRDWLRRYRGPAIHTCRCCESVYHVPTRALFDLTLVHEGYDVYSGAIAKECTQILALSGCTSLASCTCSYCRGKRMCTPTWAPPPANYTPAAIPTLVQRAFAPLEACPPQGSNAFLQRRLLTEAAKSAALTSTTPLFDDMNIPQFKVFAPEVYWTQPMNAMAYRFVCRFCRTLTCPSVITARELLGVCGHCQNPDSSLCSIWSSLALRLAASRRSCATCQTRLLRTHHEGCADVEFCISCRYAVLHMYQLHRDHCVHTLYGEGGAVATARIPAIVFISHLQYATRPGESIDFVPHILHDY
jgi:hypothetical protein